MAVFPVTLILLSVYCLGLSADQATCPKTISQEDRLAKMEVVLNEVKDGQSNYTERKVNVSSLEDRLAKMELLLNELKDGSSNCTKCMVNTHCQNDTGGYISQGYKDCKALYDAGHNTSGVYTIKPIGGNETEVFCEQLLDGGGWMVIQRRFNGTVNFTRDWDSYKNGFGSVYSEFWSGNDFIHLMTGNKDQKMKVELEHGGLTAYADFSLFWTEDEIGYYELSIGGFSNGQNNPGDSLGYHNGKYFSTYDRDHDTGSAHCAASRRSAWWYGGCAHADLNGPYSSSNYQWGHWSGHEYPLTASRMMLKTK